MKRAIHPIKADMMRLHRMFPAKFGLALMLAFGLLFGIFLKNGTTLLAFGNSVFGEDIGFCWNVIDPSAPDESLVRSALPAPLCSFRSSFAWRFYRSAAMKRDAEFLQQEVLPALTGLWHMYFRLL